MALIFEHMSSDPVLRIKCADLSDDIAAATIAQIDSNREIIGTGGGDASELGDGFVNGSIAAAAYVAVEDMISRRAVLAESEKGPALSLAEELARFLMIAEAYWCDRATAALGQADGL